MLSRLAAVVSAALLLASPALVSASSTPAAPAIPGIQPLLLQHALDRGPASADVRQTVVLSLTLRDDAGLDRLLAAQQTAGSADYHRWLSPQQFADRFSPTTAAVAEATRWARAAGLVVTEVSANRTLVTLEGTRAQLGRAFGVSLHRVHVAGQDFVTPDRTASLPAPLRRITGSVLGLTTYNPNRLHHRVATRSGYKTYGLASYTPKDFWEIYNAPAGTTGTNQTVAVITDGDLRPVARDLERFQTRYSLRHVPLTVVETTRPSSAVDGVTEYDLDTQASQGFAPGIRRLIAYNAGSLGDIHPLNQFVVERRSLTASASYGGCELINAAVGTVDAKDRVFKQAMAQGQTFWFSTGDEGSSCSVLVNTGTPVGIPNVEYPASSPYVVAVGGTSLTGQKTQPTREITWIGAGGGNSVVETAPSWQKDHLTFARAAGRGLPDISLDADPNSGFSVIVNGRTETVGGTSASAPAWNGIWARVLQRHPRIGFAAPALYRLAPGPLVDITLGTNGQWAATSGYDLSTGLGTPDVARLVSTAR
jgi:pseudomonalisin/xanthomonalisin